jgi:hypothetical protein
VQAAALASMAGIAPEFLASRWPHEREPLEAIALEAEKMRADERQDQAVRIRNEVRDLLDRSLPG